MGKYLKLIETIKEELIDSKDNLLMYVEDYVHSHDMGEEPEITFSDIHAISSEVDSIADFLSDLLNADFDIWDDVINTNYRYVQSNKDILSAITVFRREDTTNE